LLKFLKRARMVYKRHGLSIFLLMGVMFFVLFLVTRYFLFAWISGVLALFLFLTILFALAVDFFLNK